MLNVYIIDLCRSFEQCSSKPHPETKQPQRYYDIKDWLNPHSVDIHQHVKPHCFKFVKNGNNEAVMYYRKWSGEPWMGPIRLLKVTHRAVAVPNHCFQ